MGLDHTTRPKLRSGIEAGRFPQTPEGLVTLYDRAQLTRTVVNISAPAACLISLMDGSRTPADIKREFEQATRQRIEDGVPETLIRQLDQCFFLESPGFEAHYAAMVEQYRSLPARPKLAMGLVAGDGQLARQLDEILADVASVDGDGAVVGLIAPHLDHTRGRPCYAAAYAQIARRRPPDRLVVIGTNHAPRTFTPTVTGHDYETPLGRTRTDVAFIERLEARCGDLRRCELDHAREHSVELQVIWCQHLFGVDRFQLVPILCTDPDAPPEQFPFATERIGTAEVGKALHELLADDHKDTLIIAGADLSHVGRAFGDDRLLDASFLEEVRQRDAAILDHVRANDADAFLGAFACNNNPTKVCSVGCIYALMKALPDASCDVVEYHQAADPETQTGVTCAAAVFRRGRGEER